MSHDPRDYVLGVCRNELPSDDPKAPLGAAYAYVDRMHPTADGKINGALVWYGWALREAFCAGAAYERRKHGR